MDWSNRIQPSSSDAIDQNTMTDDAEVRHVQWSRKGGVGNIIVEDMFVNPDQASNIAGIIISRSAQPNGSDLQLSIDAVMRKGRDDKGAKSLITHKLSTGIWSGQSDEEKAHLKALKVETSYMDLTVATGFGQGDIKQEKAHNYYSEHISNFIDTMLHSDLISAQPAIRRLFVGAIQNNFHSMKTAETKNLTKGK